MKPWTLKPVERHSATIEGSQLRPAGYCYDLSDNQMRFMIELLESLGFKETLSWGVKEGRHYHIGPYYNRSNDMTMIQWKDMSFPTHNKDFNWKWEQLFKEEPGFEGFHAGAKFGL
jgi:hypothetical protein